MAEENLGLTFYIQNSSQLKTNFMANSTGTTGTTTTLDTGSGTPIGGGGGKGPHPKRTAELILLIIILILVAYNTYSISEQGKLLQSLQSTR